MPQQIPGGDIYPALERGTVDAAEWVGPYDDEKLGFNKVAPFYYYPGFWEGGAQITAFINLAKWNELPKTYKSLLTAACGYANVDMQAKYDARNPAALRRLVSGGAQLRPFPQEILEASYKAANELYDELSAKNAGLEEGLRALSRLPERGIPLVPGRRVHLRQLHDPRPRAGVGSPARPRRPRVRPGLFRVVFMRVDGRRS